MRNGYCLRVSFPFTSVEIMAVRDKALIAVVGKDPAGSGAGMGARDMDWSFDTLDEARAAMDRVMCISNMRCHTSINPIKD